MKNLKDLFEHQLKDLYSAENQLVEALPKMQKNANDDKLKKAFEKHLKETEGHIKRLEEITKELGIKPTGETCKAMKGLIKEAESFLEEDTEKEVRDAGLIAEAQRVEHYEISAYGTAVRYAKELGHDDIAKKLQKTLDEEYKADDLLTEMAEDRLNRKAKS
ncbi:MAG: ferritin-like domain-containing protein [Salinimicrobium sediminis]|uniref:Ferritin-like metal-binding protein YciE n=1 Tax=Salinimicrobium sediminis TaxID=1343891 RepID=A0A285X6G3_9FLAO|nr:ferritin-like domain-containing protein [Salinimicrobium sediminis]MDX1601742.1 ferritin-like domain-containing protein [Salinimicrobium sediminis]SOC80858.1 Ferritin-like metal-binding protein YciE [Salinimicrobium sediminis]